MSQAPNEAITKPSKSQQSDSVAKGLDHLRRRLLDLANRNKLINFRHSKSSIRIVDVDFEGIYASLLDERKLPFVHVPEPDGEYIAGAGEKPSAKDLAEYLGWSTSFDLATNGGQANSFPVLEYQEDFELLVRKIGTTARTAIEESGVNLLHLVFGFLEWRESDDSTQIRQAPLVVVPVSLMTPKTRDQDRSIRLQYTGEDLSTNLSLVEKMRKDFGIEIPYLDEEETPEQYFARFEPILRQKRTWRICRQVSLVLLSFGKLLMYLDLDPERWASNKPLLQHPRLVDILSASSGEALSFATEFNIDEEEAQSAPMPLVCDADSSQHSALIDAIRGKNLVIEGPPGTGKPQTITNLIAAAIADGKRVLFIAEKMAALEVVKRRLDAFGLGDFCLELHSHKTSKLGLLQSLDERIRANGRFLEPIGLGQKQQLLAEKRVDLTKYVSLLNTPYACTAKTPFDLIWQRDALRDVVPSKLQEVATITFQDAFLWDHQELQARKDMVSTYAAHLRRMVEAGGHIERNLDPWSWLSSTSFNILRQEQLLTLLPTLVALYSKRLSLIEAFSQQFSNLHADLGDWFAVLDQCFGGTTVTNTTTVDVAELSKGADRWRIATETLDPECPYDLFSALSDKKKFAAAEHFAASVQRYQGLLSQLPDGKKLLESGIDAEFRRGDEAVHGLGITDYSLATLGELEELLARSERYIAPLKRAYHELSQGLGVRESFTFKCMTDVLIARELISKAPLHLAHLRGPQFAKDGLLHVLELGQQKSAELTKERGNLEEHFIIDGPTKPDDLIRAAAAFETTPWYLRLNKQYRHAASLYRSVCSASIKRTRSQKVACLRLLVHNRAKVDLFSSADEYRSALGDYFSGLTTPWGDLITTAKWHEDLFAHLPEHQAFASEVRSAVLTLPAARLKSLLESRAASHDIENALSSLGDLHSRAPKLN